MVPLMSTSRQLRKPKPASETSSAVSEARMSRARGPQSPMVLTSSVRSVSVVAPSSTSWSVNHLRSAMPCAPPVTTRNRSSPSRITVRSERKPPAGSSTGV